MMVQKSQGLPCAGCLITVSSLKHFQNDYLPSSPCLRAGMKEGFVLMKKSMSGEPKELRPWEDSGVKAPYGHNISDTKRQVRTMRLPPPPISLL